ncbi:MAG: NUDIX hydrolase [Pseudomonadales bacterium]
MAGELFEILSADGRYRGIMPRAEVHRSGHWHRSVHVFLFDLEDRLWLQRRAKNKDLFPSRWDLSVGEHLRAGESFARGALRGLAEELGVPTVTLTALGETRLYSFEDADSGIQDHELQQAFRAAWSGTPLPDNVEVAEIIKIDAATLKAWIQQAPDDFTPWFLHELLLRPGLGAFSLTPTEVEGVFTGNSSPDPHSDGLPCRYGHSVQPRLVPSGEPTPT